MLEMNGGQSRFGITKKSRKSMDPAGLTCSETKNDEFQTGEILPGTLEVFVWLPPPENLSQFLAER